MSKVRRGNVHEQRQERRRRRLTGFEELTIKALNDPEPLIDYLLSSDADNERQLGWLLNRWRFEGRLPRRQHRSLSDKNFAVACAAYLVWRGKRAWCRHHATKIVTKDTPMNALIARAIELVTPSNPDAGEIDVEVVREAQRHRPSSEMREFMREFMPAAVAAFIEEAKTMETDE